MHAKMPQTNWLPIVKKIKENLKLSASARCKNKKYKVQR